MSGHPAVILRVSFARVFLGVSMILGAGLSASFGAEQRTSEDIIRALKPRVTRSLTVSPAEEQQKAEDARFLNSLRSRPTRSITTAERDQLASIAQKRPSIDLEINFEYNS